MGYYENRYTPKRTKAKAKPQVANPLMIQSVVAEFRGLIAPFSPLKKPPETTKVQQNKKAKRAAPSNKYRPDSDSIAMNVGVTTVSV